jgi:hypothetical protein
MTRKSLPALVLAIGVLAAFIKPAGAVLPAVGAISHKNMEWKFNWEGDVGSDIEFLERKLPDGSLKRYAIVGLMGHGFNVYDITNPDLPLLTSAFVDPGFNWEGDIQVNPRRNLVIVATESPGVTVGNGTSGGLAIVDVTDIANPVLKSHITLTGGAHNVVIIDDNIAWGLLPTTVVDYSDPAAPKNLGQKPAVCGHDVTVDLNKPGFAYSACPNSTKPLQTLDITDPVNPVVLANVRNTDISIGHQADPSPDSSLIFVTDEEGGGLTNETCPGGGLHVYDVSGKYVPGSSMTNPLLVGHWFAPFTGLGMEDHTSNGQWGNCTIHVHNLQSERWLMSVAHYSAGTFVADLQNPTVPKGTGLYDEFTGDEFGGPTDWGNTTGNFLPEGADTWSAKWTRFDDPAYDRYIFTSDITRGFDVLHYSGPMPKKVARLAADATGNGGSISGKLDRYAVYTYQGYVHKPLEGKEITIKVGNQTVTTTTGPDGSFSAPLGLAPGSYTAEVTWAGDADYQATTVTQEVSLS